MNLGFILYDYFPFGGLQNDCLSIAGRCSARGHETTIITRTWRGSRPENIRVLAVGRNGWGNVSRNERFLDAVQPILAEENFDAVIGFNRLPGLDIYYAADACYVARIDRLKGRWFRWTRRFRHYRDWEASVFNEGGATHILLITPHEVSIYRKYYQTEKSRMHVLPPGIRRRDESETARSAARKKIRAELGLCESEKLALFVGRGFRTKGLDRVVRGHAALSPDLRTRLLTVVIGENTPGRFGILATRLGIGRRLRFIGGRDDVDDFMSAADLLVHPAYSENTGTVLLEALTAGLPVLTTDTCGFANHITQADAGVVLPSPFKQREYDRCLERMLVDGKAETWRRNAIAYADSEDLYSRDEKAVELIESIVAKKSTGPSEGVRR